MKEQDPQTVLACDCNQLGQYGDHRKQLGQIEINYEHADRFDHIREHGHTP